MKIAALSLMTALTVTLWSATPEITSKITQVAIFTNGTSAVERQAKIPNLKQFLLSGEFNPFLGSIQFPSDAVVKKVLTSRPENSTNFYGDLAELYAGKKIKVWIEQGASQVKMYTGKVVDIWSKQPEERPRRYATPLILQDESGKITLLRGNIVALECADAQVPQLNRKVPQWEVTLPQPQKKFNFAYLTSGLKWFPAYRIELDGKKLHLTYSGTLQNELADLTDVKVNLVSGDPNFRYTNFRDPLSMIPPVEEQAEPQYRMMSLQRNIKNVMMSAQFDNSPDEPITEDIHYYTVGKITLKNGEVQQQKIAQGSTTYEKLARWQIPARVRESGFEVGHSSLYESGNVQDCLKFTNPLPMPLPQAPATIIEQGRTLAQIRLPWLNRKAEKILELAQAQTIEAKVLEYQTKRASQLTMFFARNYRLTEIQGELKIKNYRQSPAKLRIEADFAGTLLQADGKPQNLPRMGSVLINPTRQLVWEITLAPGAEKTLKYRYNCYLSR